MTADLVLAQVRAVRGDLTVAAAKTGMLGSADVVHAVAASLADVPLVVDPVLVATSGAVLGDDTVVAAYVSALLPVATVITPNRHEAARLLGAPSLADDDLVEAARALHDFGPAVVLTGGSPEGGCCVDVLADGSGVRELPHPSVPTTNDHGTGCTFSAALTALLARGVPLPAAVRGAQGFVSLALRISRHWRLGRGRGPVAHTFNHHPNTEES
jgi:hydroxymethylpyrimidine/phosphomethylpyrimidine kinase